MVKKNIHIVHAVLVKSRKALVERLKKVSPYVRRAQIDIIDGKFAKNKTIGPKSLKGIRTKLRLEIQLMVADVDKYVAAFVKYRPWMIIFHVESCRSPKHVVQVINTIKSSRLRVGIALNPKTPASRVKPYLKLVDQVLVMTVKPGFEGQRFMKNMLPKIRLLRKWNKKIDIEVDGGVKVGTACLAAEAGANVFAAGGAIHKAKDIKKAVQQLRDDAKCMM